MWFVNRFLNVFGRTFVSKTRSKPHKYKHEKHVPRLSESFILKGSTKEVGHKKHTKFAFCTILGWFSLHCSYFLDPKSIRIRYPNPIQVCILFWRVYGAITAAPYQNGDCLRCFVFAVFGYRLSWKLYNVDIVLLFSVKKKRHWSQKPPTILHKSSKIRSGRRLGAIFAQGTVQVANKWGAGQADRWFWPPFWNLKSIKNQLKSALDFRLHFCMHCGWILDGIWTYLSSFAW